MKTDTHAKEGHCKVAKFHGFPGKWMDVTHHHNETTSEHKKNLDLFLLYANKRSKHNVCSGCVKEKDTRLNAAMVLFSSRTCSSTAQMSNDALTFQDFEDADPKSENTE